MTVNFKLGPDGNQDSSSYTLEQGGARRVEVVGLTDKCFITAVF